MHNLCIRLKLYFLRIWFVLGSSLALISKRLILHKYALIMQYC